MAIGVVISVVLPLIQAMLPRPKDRQPEFWNDFWDKARPYVATAIFSLIVATLIMVFMSGTITDWKSALLAGYGCDSTLQKLKTGNTSLFV